jgi:hypothetical protein
MKVDTIVQIDADTLIPQLLDVSAVSPLLGSGKNN